jgi:xanthine dehydrogenase molybdopterin binding subunit/xanthine dehydrogenase small subunit
MPFKLCLIFVSHGRIIGAMSVVSSSFKIIVNGETVLVDGISTNMTLLQWLRSTGRTGTKEGCAEGDCGACSVALVDLDAHGKRTYRAVNSCILLLPMVAGREIVTVEGMARTDGLHPVQKALVNRYGSQCGYCTPGFVVSMFEAYYRTDLADSSGDTRANIRDQLNGNLCRCTGYRPIRDAMLDALEAKKRSGDDTFQERLSTFASAPTVPAIAYEASNATAFLRPASIDELLAIKAEHGAQAEVVAGATEIGVQINKNHRRYSLLISTDGLQELSVIEKDDVMWRVGGAATLTALEEALAGEYPMIDKMLRVFASRQIRNRATLAGNIVTASPIADMPPVLLALDAEVVLAKKSREGVQERTVPISDFFVGYRKSAIAPDEILHWICLPRYMPGGPNGRRRMDSYKVSKRRELDISIVAAAFCVDTNEANVITHARLAFGGVAATPVRAKRTEALLLGKRWNEATVAEACDVLATEFTPLDDHRSGADYRRDLVVSLFEKFFRGDCSRAQDEVLLFDRTPRTDADADDASRALSHDSAVGHVTGAALYVDDIARRRDMLEMWPVCSPHARARVISIDTTVAATSPGVVAVLTAKDVPGMNDVGAVRHDEPLFAAEGCEACFHGHIVALVVGDSYETCRLAAEKVKVIYEPLPPVLGVRDAMAKGSFHTEPHVIRRLDCDTALANSTHRLAGEMELGGQEHFYLESHAAWAECGEEGEIFVCASTQHPSEIQAAVSHLLDLPRNKVVVQCPRMGGGFGGKETQGNTWAGLAALAAFKTRRLVRVQLDRDLDMVLTGKRHPFHARFEVGYEPDGLLNAARIALVSDGGWALDLSESVMDRALFHLDNAYYVPACDFSGRVARTNVVSHTAFRGFGGPQGMVVIEEILDRIARRLRLPPEQVRERNLYRGSGDSNTTHYGQSVDSERMHAIWSRLLTTARFAERRARIDKFNATSGTSVKRGIAITPVKFGISFTATWLNQAGALVLIYRDGTVQVNHGGTEMGQGLYTKIKGVAMRELGLPARAIHVMRTQTDKVPNTSATAASAASDLNGQAVRDACETLRERLAAVAAEMLSTESVVFRNGVVCAHHFAGREIPFVDVVERAWVNQVPLSATGFYRTPGIGYDRLRGRGRPFYYFAYGAAVTEVEVDGYSGMKRVLAVDILHDVGDSLNPGVDLGQIEGAFVQGMGWLTGEELKWSEDGKLLTHSASTYQIPSIGDTPERMTVELLPEAAQPGTIHGSKAVGEPPLMLAISVREAIRDAIAAFGAPGGEVTLPSPATHEAIRAAIKARLAHLALGELARFFR